MTSVEDKENASEIETIIIDDTRKKEIRNTFFSPPKKKFKQDAVPFTKLSKNEETVKKDENNIQKDENQTKLSEADVIVIADRQLPTSKHKKSHKKSPNDSTKNIQAPKNLQSAKKLQSTRKLLSTKNIVSTENVPSTENIPANENDPSNENATPMKDTTSTENIQSSEIDLSTEDVQSTENDKSTEDVQSTEVVISAENVISTENVSPKIVQTPKNSSSGKKVKCSKPGSLPFPKILKEDALKEAQNLLTKIKDSQKKETPGIDQDESCVEEIEIMDVTPSNKNSDTPCKKTPPPTTDKKLSPISKEERQQLKEEKEVQKAARLKEVEEKRKKKEEEKVLKQADKEKRENERKEKEKLRDEEKKKKEEERKKKEEERKKKEEEKKSKEDEKQKKDELSRVEREKRDVEKEKKEVERRMKEEQKRQEEEKKKQDDDALKKKKEKEASHFRSFFTKKCAKNNKAGVAEVYLRFKPFQQKPNMEVAPLVRNEDINRELLDNIMESELPNLHTYLQEQAAHFITKKIPKYISRRKRRHDLEEQRKLDTPKKPERPKREFVEKSVEKQSIDLQNVVIIDDNSNDMADDDIEDDSDESVCVEKHLYVSKLLQFSENTRPSYYGTWRKKSLQISGRKPFAKDTAIFNYDVDSDEEWIDEPGENLSDAVDEDEEEEKETEDDQDGFFVPHGYLSDDEGIENQLDGEDQNNSEESPTIKSVDTHEDDKLRLKVCSFEKGFQKKLKQLNPICIGITYAYNVGSTHPVFNDYVKVTLFKPVSEKEEEEEMDVTSPQSDKKIPQSENGKNIAMTVPEEAMPSLIRFLHGNVSGLPTMIPKFREYWMLHAKECGGTVRPHISKRQLEKKIQAIASRVSNKEVGKMCYVVKEDIVNKYGLKNDLKYGEGLPQINNNSSLHDGEVSENKQNDNINESIETDICCDLSMEIN